MEKPFPVEGPFTTGIKSWKNNRWVCADGDRYSVLHANRDQYAKWETFTFVPVDVGNSIYAIKAHYNDKYVSVREKDILWPTATTIDLWEKFRLHYIDSQTLALQSLKNNRWVCVDDKITVTFGSNPQLTVTFVNVLAANRDAIGLWEEFYFAPGIPLKDGSEGSRDR